MLKAEQIPDEVVAVYVDAYYGKDLTRKAAFAAALNAWPGVHHYEPNAEPYYGKHIILPLPQEASDDPV